MTRRTVHSPIRIRSRSSTAAIVGIPTVPQRSRRRDRGTDRTSSHLMNLSCRTPPSGGDGYVKRYFFRDGGHGQNNDQISRTLVERVDRRRSQARAAARLLPPQVGSRLRNQISPRTVRAGLIPAPTRGVIRRRGPKSSRSGISGTAGDGGRQKRHWPLGGTSPGGNCRWPPSAGAHVQHSS